MNEIKARIIQSCCLEFKASLLSKTNCLTFLSGNMEQCRTEVTKNCVRRKFCPRKLASSGCYTGQKWWNLSR